MRVQAEQQLASNGVVLPTPQTAQWLVGVGCNDSKLLTTFDCDGHVSGALGVGIGRSRSLPGHVIYRVPRLAACREASAETMLLEGLAQIARRDPRCIRLHIELFEPDPELRARLSKTLQELGFVKAAEPTAYAYTPYLDLGPSEDELFAKCASSARRNVRAPAKRGLYLATVTDPSYAARLQALMNEVFERTGGTTRDLPWTTILEMSAASPERSRIIGLYAPNETGPEGLVAFSWGCVNGNYVTYEAGASTRSRDLGNLALAYAPLWDLIAWAKRSGARWFDFGGVPSPKVSSTSEDPLAGIADFKRFFCERIVEGGEDWILEPKPVRAFLARAVRAAATRARA